MSGTRTNAYYLGLLAARHPQIYADHLAGKYKTVKDARRAAGMISERTRLHELKNAWAKASAGEKRAFENWVKGHASTRAPSPIRPDGKLAAWAVQRIREVTLRRGIKMGDVMREMGASPNDQSLAMAVQRDTKVRPSLARPLKAWLDANAGV